MDTFKLIIHWASYAYYLYVFGYASLFKVFQKQSMMQSMASLGFNRTWTIAIGVGELLGVILLIIGLFKPPFRHAAILLLFPFAVGALSAHMAHQEYKHYYNALIMCILSVVMILTDKELHISLYPR